MAEQALASSIEAQDRGDRDLVRASNEHPDERAH